MISLSQRSIIIVILLIQFHGCRTENQNINTQTHQTMVQVNHYTSPEISGPYSQAVRCGNFLFVGSQSSTDLKTLEFIDGTIEQQTQIVLNNIVKILNDAGYDSSHIVHCTIYLRDRNDYQKMNLVYGGYFEEGKYPTRSVIIGTEFRNPKTRVEISAIAYKPH